MATKTAQRRVAQGPQGASRETRWWEMQGRKRLVRRDGVSAGEHVLHMGQCDGITGLEVSGKDWPVGLKLSRLGLVWGFLDPWPCWRCPQMPKPCPTDPFLCFSQSHPLLLCPQTLFNPNKTVVKMFLVTYDFQDMPANHMTFLRHRIFLVPVGEEKWATMAPSNPPGTGRPRRVLCYLMHLR